MRAPLFSALRGLFASRALTRIGSSLASRFASRARRRQTSPRPRARSHPRRGAGGRAVRYGRDGPGGAQGRASSGGRRAYARSVGMCANRNLERRCARSSLALRSLTGSSNPHGSDLDARYNTRACHRTDGLSSHETPHSRVYRPDSVPGKQTKDTLRSSQAQVWRRRCAPRRPARYGHHGPVGATL